MPLVLITLERFAPDHQHEQYEVFKRDRSAVFANYAHDVVFDGKTWLSSEGNRTQVWHRIMLESFEPASEYINAVTEPAYTEIEGQYDDDNFKEFAHFVGHVKPTKSYDKPVVLLFAQAPVTYQRELVDVVTESLRLFDGQVGFAMPIEKINGNSSLIVNYLALIEFENGGRIIDWLENTIRKSQFMLLRKRIDDLSLVVAMPS